MAYPSFALLVFIAAATAAVVSTYVPAAIAADAPAPGPSCDDTINSLLSCFGYVTGQDPLPSEECCAGFATVRQAQPVCLCQLVGNDGGGGTTGINLTLALQLPSLCNVTAVDAATCAGVTSPASPPEVPAPAQSPDLPSSASPPGATGTPPPAGNSSSSEPSTGTGPGNSAHSSRSVSSTSILWCAIAGLGTVAVSFALA